ncbi:hypothetical protein H6F78_23870 [Coleofasciculus sp. FACHB-64]|uniref:hypothetical protein n=1 Tax=Cyanophyceae TaxID=3028117 RepID=UPI0016841ABD|nr:MULTISPECIES: hypothetical protein [unclassified Coleofasciculus]MBD1837030.1 hypothetical protein [Coleofasciculus sp. FACHB-501]MBD2048598.1 hypothetical protein [Coleofasciculus sp. FACHB-64]
MQPNYFTKGLSTVGRWLATTLFCVSAIAFVWQGAFFSTSAAMAAPSANLIASVDTSDQVKGKANEDLNRSKNFIDDVKDKVKATANKNADRVEEGTDGHGNLIERKANRDAARIEKRADEDAARTKEAVDNTKGLVEQAVDSIKDAFGN